jgi:hypothetical protein
MLLDLLLVSLTGLVVGWTMRAVGQRRRQAHTRPDDWRSTSEAGLW